MLSISRSSLYCEPVKFTDEDIFIMNHIDRIHTGLPGFGVEKIYDRLRRKYKIKIGIKKTKSYMAKMNILKSQLSNNAYGYYPYLLKEIEIDRPNQVWSIDISYIGMENSF